MSTGGFLGQGFGVTSHGVQKALEYFWFFENAAREEGWTAEERAARFHGAPLHPGGTAPFWPRVFILSQYTAQARLVRLLLQMNFGVHAAIAANFVVRNQTASSRASTAASTNLRCSIDLRVRASYEQSGQSNQELVSVATAPTPMLRLPCLQAQTIDKCQGDEADAVILSLVMTYDLDTGAFAATHGVPAVSPHSARRPKDVTPSDFVQYPNRANVAISRARYALVVVSSDSIEASMKRASNRTVWGPMLRSSWAPAVGDAEPAFLTQPALASDKVCATFTTFS